jgi:membrane associated rhomboid family serine protease
MNKQKTKRYGQQQHGAHVMFIAVPDLHGTVTSWIIVACVVVFVIHVLLNLWGIWLYQASYSFLGLSRSGLAHGRVWQVFTSPFLHFGIQHLVFNMLSLAFFGGDVEQRLGRGKYIVFSLICALTGSIGFLLFGTATSIGAGYSGVIYGILAAAAVLWPNRVIRMFWFFPMKMKWAMLILGLMGLFLAVQPGKDAIAQSAHLGGAVAGLIYITIWKHWHAQQNQNIGGNILTLQPSDTKQKRPKNRSTTIRVPDEL